MGTENLRREPRVELDLRVELETPRETRTLPIHDASYSGMFLKSQEVLPLRRLVRLTCQLPDGSNDSLRLLATIANQLTPEQASQVDRFPGMGLQLYPSTPDALDRWRSFIRERCLDDPRARREIRRLELPHVAAHLPDTDRLREVVETIADEGQMFLRTSNVYDVGSEVVCELVHPDTRRNLPLEARVTQSKRVPRRERGMELNFSELNDDDFENLEAFIDGEEMLEAVTTPPDLPDVPG